MGIAQQLIVQKADEVASLGPDATALEAAQLMNERHIGSIVVLEKKRLVGIFTERDVLRRIVASQRDAAATTMREVMTTPVAVAAPHTKLNEIRGVMRERRIRHVPVVGDDDRVLGMISIGDLNRDQHDVDVQTIRYLEQYMSVM